MTARAVPPKMPITMAMIVNSIVTTTPRRVSGLNRYSPMVPNPTFGFLASDTRSAAARKRRTAAVIQRPQWRTGIALIGSGRSAKLALPTGADGARPIITGLLVDLGSSR